MPNDVVIGDPGRIRMAPKRETVDSLGVFSPNEHGQSPVVPGGSMGALEVPGVDNIAQMPDPTTPAAPRKASEPVTPEKPLTPRQKKALAKKQRSETMKQRWAERRAAQSGAKPAPVPPSNVPSDAALEDAANAQSLARRVSAPSPRAISDPPPVKVPKFGGGVILSLPDMGAQPMEVVEAEIIRARKALEDYAQQAQNLRMASNDRTCKFCGKFVPDGQWYARDCPVDPNGRLVYDIVFCSQPCHINYTIQMQNEGQGAMPATAHYDLSRR
jgi:hypothetical protein